MTKTKTTGAWLSGVSTAEYFDVTTMTIFRWQQDEKLGFPKPKVINGRKYWAVHELDAWMRKTATNKADKR